MHLSSAAIPPLPPPPPFKKHCCENSCVLDGGRYVSHSTCTSKSEKIIRQIQKASSVLSWNLSRTMKKVKLWASRRAVDDDWQALVISHSHAWLWRLHLSSSSSLTFSSVWFKWRGVQAQHKMLMWFLSSHSHQVNFSFPRFKIFILLNLLLVRKQKGTGCELSMKHIKSTRTHASSCSRRVSEIYVQKEKCFQ